MQANDQSHDAASAQMGQIMDEYLERANRGERPSIEEYVDRYPDLAEVIRKMLPALEVMQGSDGLDTTGDAPVPNGIQPHGPLGDFHIVRELGRGGMGVVYEATQISLGRTVALKVLPFAAAMDDRQLQRFKNEAHAAACLHHAHIVPVFGVGCERGVHYYAMQLIEGQSLANVIEFLKNDPQVKNRRPNRTHGTDESATSPDQGSDSTQAIAALSTAHDTNSREYFRSIAKLGQQAAEALDHAHQSGVVHRDVKPANLILDYRGDLWVTDFGLAQMQSDARLTMTGDLMGTLRYMSPEQALAKRVTIDHRTDIYSLGATIYELLTLKSVFTGKDREELLRQIAFEEPKPARRLNHSVPVELETIVMKAMCKNPADRYASSQELADDLQRFLDDKPIQAKRPTIAQHISGWTRRHRGVAATIAAAMVLAIIGLGITVAAIANERQKLADQKQETENALEKSETLVGELQVQQSQLENEKKTAIAAELAAREAEDVANRANEELQRLVELEQQARRREQEANHRIERNFYIHQTMLADLSRREGDLSRARNLLSKTKPEFRGLEWHYLTRSVNDAEFIYRGGATRLPKKALRAHLSPNGQFVAMAIKRDPSPEDDNWLSTSGHIDLAFLSIETGKPFFLARSETKPNSLPMEQWNNVIACDFSQDSQRAAVAIFNNRIAVIDLLEKRELFALEGHSDRVTCVCFSDDGKRLASGSLDKTVRIWDLESREPLRIYDGHQQPIQDVAFCPGDNQRIASRAGVWSDDPTVRSMMPIVQSNSAFLGCGTDAFHPDLGGFPISNVGPDTPAAAAGIQTGDVVVQINGQVPEEAWFLSQVLAAHKPGEKIKLELRRGDQVHSTEVTLGRVPRWVAKEQLAALTGLRAKSLDELHIWDANTGELTMPSINAKKADWSPNGEFLAYADWNRGRPKLVVLNRAGETVIEKKRTFNWARFHPNGTRVLLGGKALEEWDLESGEQVREFKIAGMWAMFGDYILGGTYIMVANSGINLVEIIDAASGATVGRRNVSSLNTRGAFLFDDVGERFVFEQYHRKLAMWKVRNWFNFVDDAFNLEITNATRIVSSNDGRFFAVAKKGPSYVFLHDGQTGERIHRFPVVGWSPRRILFNADSTQLACIGDGGGNNHYVQIWDLNSFQTVVENGPANGTVESAIFHEGKLRTLVSDGSQCSVRDAATQETIRELPMPRRRGNSNTFRRLVGTNVDGILTADGSKAILRRVSAARQSRGYQRDPVEIWDLDTGEHQLLFEGQQIFTASRWISPGGNYLYFYHSEKGRIIHDIQANREYPLEVLGTKAIAFLIWSPDETRLLLVGRGGESQLVDARTGRELITLRHMPSVVHAAFSKNGKLLMTTDKGVVNQFNATDLADDPPQDPKIFARLAWSVVVNATAGTPDILRAVAWAKEARQRANGMPYYDHILGATHYRAGNYRAAVELLSQSLKEGTPVEHTVTGPNSLLANPELDKYRCFLAMAKAKLGEHDEAMRIFWRTFVSEFTNEEEQQLAAETAQSLGVDWQDKVRMESHVKELRKALHPELTANDRTQPRTKQELRAKLQVLAHDFNLDQKLTENELSPSRWSRLSRWDRNQDGAIELAELSQLGSWRSPDFAQFVLRFDKDKDGEIDKKEVHPAFGRVLERFDINKDGRLQESEFEKVRSAQDDPLQAASLLFRLWDDDKNGELTPRELPLVDFWNQISQYDTDSDGRLTSHELQAGFEKQLDDDGKPSGAGLPFGLLDAGSDGDTAEGRRGMPHPSGLLRMLDRIYERNDTNGDGVIAADEVDQTRPFWNWLKDHDTNEDGKLDLQEVRKSLQEASAAHGETDETSNNVPSGGGRFGRSTPPPEFLLSVLDRMYEHNDKNGDGAIGKEEVENRSPIWNWLKDHDTNNNEKLELEEVRTRLQAELDEPELNSD